MTQVTLLTGPERRRRWSPAERATILAAAFAPGAVVADVGRQFEVSTSLIYKWRRDHLPATEGFSRVVLAEAPGRRDVGSHGRICLTNNAAERALRGIALGRKSWLFAGSDRGGQRAAVMYSLIITARMNDVDPQAWLADVLARIADHPASKLNELLPWNWKTGADARRAA